MLKKNGIRGANRPALAPAHRGWVHDLPGPDEDSSTPIRDYEIPAINSMDATCLELSRKTHKMRGLLLALAPLGITWLAFSIYILATSETMFPLEVAVGAIAMLWWTVTMIRVDISIPRDEPIRFNRLRRKVYVYRFHYIWWNPFARWGVTTNAYHWTDLRAEVWRQRGATGQGGLIITWGVSIAVVKPGTNQVIDRFPLSVGQDEGSSWDYVRAYMQYGPGALPAVETFNDPNKAPPCNLALRLAPRVQWPADMDAESRT
ncbi:DUF6708 domain-containing protein [Achromobacter spanius]|nr:DUF6708 domain-containing protein [Achromobacter spanius]